MGASETWFMISYLVGDDYAGVRGCDWGYAKHWFCLYIFIRLFKCWFDLLGFQMLMSMLSIVGFKIIVTYVTIIPCWEMNVSQDPVIYSFVHFDT